MKYLKYLIVIVAVLLLIFIGKGLLTPTVSYESEITVNKPLKEAWAVVNDESKLSQWLKGITKIEHVSGEKGAVGAVTKYTFDQNGKESVIQETIKDIKENEHVAMDFVMEGAMTMNYKMDFSEKDGKTHIRSSTVNEGDGIFMKSMLSFMKSGMKKQEDENMNNLKKVIEENTTDYFPAPPAEEVEETSEETQE